MRKIVLVLVALSVIAIAHAQTRRIAHRSHSSSRMYRHDENSDNYGIPMHTTLYPSTRFVPIPVSPSAVTWIADTVNGVVTWRLDTMRTPINAPTKSVSYEHLIINNVSELGHVCKKVTEH